MSEENNIQTPEQLQLLRSAFAYDVQLLKKLFESVTADITAANDASVKRKIETDVKTAQILGELERASGRFIKPIADAILAKDTELLVRSNEMVQSVSKAAEEMQRTYANNFDAMNEDAAARSLTDAKILGRIVKLESDQVRTDSWISGTTANLKKEGPIGLAMFAFLGLAICALFFWTGLTFLPAKVYYGTTSGNSAGQAAERRNR